MKTAPLLSIGMIFKNEARCLERCLKSLQPLRDAVPCELIMADTGSDDGSREIAERYADEVFDFPWINDFAAARNAVLDRCHGEWYLSMDCDEWLDEDITELAAFLKGKRKNDCAFVIVRNYESTLLDKGGYSDFRGLRLLWLPSGRRFKGAIHEQFGYREPVAYLTGTILHHDGYVYVDMEDKKKKLNRNLRLLRRELEKDPKNLRVLLQCIESGGISPDYTGYLRQGVAAVQEHCPGWETYGPAILSHGVNGARIHRLEEMEQWAAYAQENYKDSIFIRVDLNYSLFLSAHGDKDWKKAIRCGEAYCRGLRVLRNSRHSPKLEDELAHSSVLYGSRPIERDVLIGLANAYSHTGDVEKALNLLTELDGGQLTAEQAKNATVAFCQLHSYSDLDISSVLLAFYEQIGQETPNKATKKQRLNSFTAIAAAPFTTAHRTEEQREENYRRPAYTAFACLAQQCEAGRAAKIMMTSDISEMKEWLLRVEDWQTLPIEALEHALAAGLAFPFPEMPLNIEVLDGLAARVPWELAKKLSQDTKQYPDTQTLLWTQALAMVTLRGFKWEMFSESEKEKASSAASGTETPPEYSAEGLALLRRFAALEAEALPQLYTPQLLTEQNAALLPPMHRWGLFCALAFASLNRGQPQEYLAMLRHSLKHCPGQKSMVQFLLDRFLDDARPKASPELLALAEKVRGILAAYGPDNPAAKAIRESDAYKQVAWLLEETPGLPVQ